MLLKHQDLPSLTADLHFIITLNKRAVLSVFIRNFLLQIYLLLILISLTRLIEFGEHFGLDMNISIAVIVVTCILISMYCVVSNFFNTIKPEFIISSLLFLIGLSLVLIDNDWRNSITLVCLSFIIFTSSGASLKKHIAGN